MATPAEPRKGGERAGQAPGWPPSTARSTMISAASRSSALRNSSSLSPSGTLRRAGARKNSTPVNGSPSRPLINSSMLTPRRVSACVTSRTMPGRSLPTISNVTTRAGFSTSAAAPRSIDTCRPEGASFASADSSGMRFSSGTLTSTTPANLPASRTERLSSQVPPKSKTFSEIALTSPGLSSPTKVRTSDVMMRAPNGSAASLSQNKAAQIGVRREVADVALDKLRVDANLFAGPVGGGEAHLVEHALHHRLQPARADVLDRSVDLGGEAGDRRYCVIGKFEVEAFGLHQRDILLDEARLGVGQNALEILLGQRFELDPDRQAALKFRQEVGGLGDVEGAGGDKKDVVGLDRAVLGGDRRALDQRQEIALHALAGNIAAAPTLASADLIDLVEKNDAVALDLGQCVANDGILIEQLLGLSGDQRLVGVLDRHPFRLRALALAKNIGDVDGTDRGAGHVRQFEHRHAGSALRQFDLDLLVVELARAQLAAEGVTGGGG